MPPPVGSGAPLQERAPLPGSVLQSRGPRTCSHPCAGRLHAPASVDLRCSETRRGPGHPSPAPGTLRCRGRRAQDSPNLQPGARGQGSSLPPLTAGPVTPVTPCPGRVARGRAHRCFATTGPQAAVLRSGFNRPLLSAQQSRRPLWRGAGLHPHGPAPWEAQDWGWVGVCVSRWDHQLPSLEPPGGQVKPRAAARSRTWPGPREGRGEEPPQPRSPPPTRTPGTGTAGWQGPGTGGGSGPEMGCVWVGGRGHSQA